MDATRISDGKRVMLKWLKKSDHPFEVGITQLLGASNLSQDPRNHCVPLYEVLYPRDDSDIAILVIPFLRDYDDPRFDTIGEIIEFFRVIFEGIQFMHSLHIAHRDIKSNNIMMDVSSMFPQGFHPVATSRKPDFYNGDAKYYTRTQRPHKYYIIDFGLSCYYDPANGPPQDYPIVGGDKSVPEFQGLGVYNLYNPFPTDIYYLGNMIRQDFLLGSFMRKTKLGLDFMESLVADMVQDDPAARPTIDEVVARFEKICLSLSSSKLRSRVAIGPTEDALVGCYYGFPHWSRRIRFILRRVPPVPSS